MGDRRASIKIEFSMHGETKKADMWINWSPDTSDCSGVDQRVLDFFSESAREMESKFWQAIEEDARTRRAEAEQEAERKEYERLKMKFEGIKGEA
jgi:hypothetical protein